MKLSLCGMAMLMAQAALLFATHAFAHGIAGDRVFPATIATDDPAAESEASFPTTDRSPNPRDDNGNAPKQTDIGGELDVLVAPHFAIGVSDAWTSVATKNETAASGYQNLEMSGKYQFYQNDEHEVLMSAGLVAEVGGTGAVRIGADPSSTFTPTFYFGKGMGDLPDSMDLLKPFAITSAIGFAVAQNRSEPDEFQPGFAVEYSMQYLKSSVKDYGFPEFVNHLVPVVEFPLTYGVDNGGHSWGGTANPGVIYLGNTWQVGVEAIVPLTSATQNGTGVIGQFHVFLDDLFPAVFSKPIFGGN